MQHGNCRYGDECAYAHDDSELRLAPPPQKKKKPDQKSVNQMAMPQATMNQADIIQQFQP